MEKSLLLMGMFLLLFALPALAQDLPPGLIKIQEANQEMAINVLKNVSFLIAFLAGVTTILSPCILPIIPAFFAYAFKEKKQMTRMTLVFFAGFTPIFVLLGIVVTSVAKVLVAFFEHLDIYITIAGVLMIFLGISYFFGKGFRLLPFTPKMPEKSKWGVFVFGILFGFGWVLCIGPILSGVLLAASIFQSYVTTMFLMISYSLGVFVPLLLISFFYDKYNLGQSAFMKGKSVDFSLFGKKIHLHSNNMIAGSMLIFVGVLFVAFKGTGIFNGLQLFGLRNYFYTLQDVMLENILIANIIGVIILGLIAWGIWRFAIQSK